MDINIIVDAIQENPVSNEILGASEDGYVLTWDNADGYWAARPNETCCGSLVIYSNTTALVTNAGAPFVINTGWANGQSVNTTLNATNGTITVGKTGIYMISFNTTWGCNTFEAYYQLTFNQNGSRNNSMITTLQAIGGYNSAPQTSFMQCMVSANAGDTFEVLIQPLSGSTSAYYPTFWMANFSVWQI